MTTFHHIPLDHIPTADPLIPPLLHLIWVGTNAAPAYVAEYLDKWRTLMPDWTVRYWTNADLTEAEFDADILAKIHASEQGAQKADLMRYFIIHKHGGVYMDVDVIPHKSLEPIRSIGPVVLCHDLPMTWPYISIGFFAATPGHPVFEYACQLCRSATLNTTDVHMKTGPRILGLAVYHVQNTYALLDCHYFYRNMVGQQALTGSRVLVDVEARFGSHFYAKNW